jgi:hypothetical protein
MHAQSYPNSNQINMETSSSTTMELAKSFHGGQIIEYQSEAAEFWKRREYKGLEAMVGKTEV